LHREQFEKLALEHMDAVYRLSLQLTKHPDRAADLVQETFVRALRASSRFEEVGGGMRSWLFRIAHNLFFSDEERRRRHARPSEAVEWAQSSERMPDEPAPAWNLASFDWEHVDERLKKAMEDLRPEFREILLLWGVEGLRYREIAEILDVPIGTVMSRLHRARAVLAQDLSELAEEIRVPTGSPPEAST